MIIDARDALNTDSNYRPYTLRLALWNAICDHLTAPHKSLVISRALDAHGETVPVRSLQISAAQIIPKEWKVFTERNADGHGLILYRWS